MLVAWVMRGVDLSLEVRVVGRGIVTQRCARGTRKLPSRQLVDLQFGLVDTHSADWEPPTCCLLAWHGLRVSGKQGPLRNVPPRRRVERIGTQEASNLASHDVFSGKASVDRSRILVNVLFIRFSICWIGKEIYKFYKFHKVYKLWIDLKICKFKMLYLERQVLTDQES